MILLLLFMNAALAADTFVKKSDTEMEITNTIVNKQVVSYDNILKVKLALEAQLKKINDVLAQADKMGLKLPPVVSPVVTIPMGKKSQPKPIPALQKK